MRTVEETRVALETADRVLVALRSELRAGDRLCALIAAVEEEQDLGRASLVDALAFTH